MDILHAATSRRELGPGALAIASAAGTVSVTDSTGISREAIPARSTTGTVTFQTPREVASGPGRVIVRGAGVRPRARDIRIEALAPGLFAAVPVVAEGAIYLSIYATGVTAGRTPPVVTLGAVTLPMLDSETQSQFIGLDQINIGPMPAELLGRRDLRLVLTVDGVRSNALSISLQ